MFDLERKICYNCIYYVENEGGSYYCEIFNKMVHETKSACEKFRNDYSLNDESK